MKKEILIAVILGLILGGIIVLGFYQSQRKISSTTPLNIKRLEPTATDSGVPTHTRLIINSPYDGQIFSSGIATISGTTSPSSYLAIVSSADEIILRSDTLGFFSTEFELQSGQNDISVYNFDESGQIDKKDFSVVFSTEFKNE